MRTARLLLVAFVVLVSALFGAPSTLPVLADPISAHQPAQPAPGTTTKVPFGGTFIAKINNMYRARYRIEPGRNVATFQYVKDGEVYYVTVASVSAQSKGPKVAVFNVRDARGNLVQLPDKDGNLHDELQVDNETITVGPKPTDTRQTVSGKHSEQLIDMILEKWGILPGQVQEIFTELEPCNLPANSCAVRIIPKYEKAAVSYNFDYHDPASRAQGVKDLQSAVRRLYDRLDLLQTIFRVAKDPALRGDLANQLSGLGAPPPGGIDFSTLQLRFLSEARAGDSMQLRYSFSGASGGNSDPDAGSAAALQSSDAFFVWLELTPDKFWVNLNPSEPDRIIDPRFGTTDAGRILLQADLQMKKTVAKLIHPDSALGGQFWHALVADPDQQVCLSFRQWIVPGVATVHEDRDGIYIVDAPLTVKLESEYLKAHGAAAANSCPTADQATRDRNEATFRSLILPQVETAVNSAPEYEPLRRVYLTRVAAEWYRQRSKQQPTLYGHLINQNDVSSWPAREPWSPKTVFDQYVDSYTKGEFHVTQQHQDGIQIVTNTYIYGGVDFSRITFSPLDQAAFQARQPDLTSVVDSSMTHPAADRQGQVWLGADVRGPSSQAATSESTASQTTSNRGWLFIGGLALLLLVVLAWGKVRQRLGKGAARQ